MFNSCTCVQTFFLSLLSLGVTQKGGGGVLTNKIHPPGSAPAIVLITNGQLALSLAYGQVSIFHGWPPGGGGGGGMVWLSYGSRPLKSIGRHGHFLNLTGDIRLSDNQHGL